MEEVFLLRIQPKEVAEVFVVIFAERASEARKATVLRWVGGGEGQMKTAAGSWCFGNLKWMGHVTHNISIAIDGSAQKRRGALGRGIEYEASPVG